MKMTIFLLLIPSLGFSQSSFLVELKNEMCINRGHYIPYRSILPVPIRLELIDTDTSSFVIYFDPSDERGTCERCHKKVTQPVMLAPDTSYVWRLND